MAGGATTLTTPRAAIETLLETISGLKVYDHSPRDLDELPAVEMLLPTIRRAGLLDREGELSRTDWTLEWPLRLHVRLDDPDAAAAEALQRVGQIIGAVDANETLDNSPGVMDAKVTEAIGGYVTRDADGNALARPKVVYDLTLSALVRVS